MPHGCIEYPSVPLPRDPHPTVLWTLRREGKIASCEVHLVPNGIELRVLRNGAVLWVPGIFFRGGGAGGSGR